MTNKSKTAPDNAGEFSEYDLTLDYTGYSGLQLGELVGRTIYYHSRILSLTRQPKFTAASA